MFDYNWRFQSAITALSGAVFKSNAIAAAKLLPSDGFGVLQQS
jgi:hypothetical protein